MLIYFYYQVGNTLPASWAHAATQTMDLYQQIYAKNITYYRRDLIDLFQVRKLVSIKSFKLQSLYLLILQFPLYFGTILNKAKKMYY